MYFLKEIDCFQNIIGCCFHLILRVMSDKAAFVYSVTVETIMKS